MLAPPGDPIAAQRRTLRVLVFAQVVSGAGIAIGLSVGALLVADLAGVGVAGLAQSAVVVGGALFAIPASWIVERYGRRPSLASGFGIAAAGAGIVVIATAYRSVPLVFAGFFLFGGATAASLQARYAAVDLAPAAMRGRHLSLVVWATTLGAVAGPNLAAASGRIAQARGLPTFAGPFAFAAGLIALCTLGILMLLRPDPAVLARTLRAASPTAIRAQVGMRAAWRAVAASRAAMLGIGAMAIGHVVMVGVMSMTPVHIRDAGAHPEHTLTIVGLVLSAHIAGMYALAPLVGWLADRAGRRVVILLGSLLLVAACILAGTSGHDNVRLAVALTTLGLGWSSTMVAGSTLLTESVPDDVRAAAQGLSDFLMGIAGASAGALSGLIVETRGFATLAFSAALVALILVGAQAPRMRLASRSQR